MNLENPLTPQPMSTPVFIIAQQRSGTNLLRRSLATTGCFWDLDEVFDPKTESFWPFHVEQVQQNASLSLPEVKTQRELFERFLGNHLKNEKPFTLVDVKYNSTHLLDGMWHSPVELPGFVQWLIHKKYPVIHLVRKNCLENYVSLLAGNYTGQWVVGKSDSGTQKVRLKLDADETIFQVQRREREIERFRKNLAQTNHMELEYETLVDDRGKFTKEIAQKIYGFLGLRNDLSIQVSTRKTGRPIHETVENYETEILPALLRHGLANDKNKKGDSAEPGLKSTKIINNKQTRVISVYPRPTLDGIPRIQRREANSKPVFVIAMQRSGTNLLRKSLATSPCFHDLNEIFDPYQKLFWPFRERLIGKRPELSVPTARNQLEIFESFVDQSLENDKPYTFIDIKYNSTGHLNKVWHHPGSRPLLFDWLIENRYPVIHLVRENIFANYVSNVIAYKSKVWLVKSSNPAASISVKLNARETIRKIQAFQTQIDVYRKWLEPTNHIELTYESLIDESGGFSQDVVRQTCELVGSDEQLEITIPTRKTGRSLSQMIENYESEIAPVLLENGYADWLTNTAA